MASKDDEIKRMQEEIERLRKEVGSSQLEEKQRLESQAEKKRQEQEKLRLAAEEKKNDQIRREKRSEAFSEIFRALFVYVLPILLLIVCFVAIFFMFTGKWQDYFDYSSWKIIRGIVLSILPLFIIYFSLIFDFEIQIDDDDFWRGGSIPSFIGIIVYFVIGLLFKDARFSILLGVFLFFLVLMILSSRDDTYSLGGPTGIISLIVSGIAFFWKLLVMIL